MLMPSLFGENLFDEFFEDFPMPREFQNIDRRLYGKNAAREMKTDVHEHEDHYEVDIDLPGFKKDEITLSLENGYLSVTAAKGVDKDEKNKKGKIVHQERYEGSMTRSFYIGENVKEEDVQAKYEDGVLTLDFPKEKPVALPERKTIQIQG